MYKTTWRAESPFSRSWRHYRAWKSNSNDENWSVYKHSFCTCDSERICVHLLLKATGEVFDPTKYQNLKPQNKHSHFQEVHQVGTFGKSAKYEAGQLLMSLPVHPEKTKTKTKKQTVTTKTKQLKKNPLHIEYSMWNRIFHIENMNLWEHIAYEKVTLIRQPSYENLKCNFIFQYCNYSFHQCFVWVFFSWGMVWTRASEHRLCLTLGHFQATCIFLTTPAVSFF